jgi:PAS domain S-box-containing protein
VSARRVALLALSGALLYAGAITLAATSDHAGGGIVLIAIAAGLSFTVTGVVATARRPHNRTGSLMLAVGFFWSLGSLTLSSSSVMFTIGALTQQLAFAPLAHLLLAYPTGRLDRLYHRRLVLGVWATVLVGPLLIGMVEDDPTSCSKCPDSAIVIRDSHALGIAAEVVFTAAAVVLALAALVELVRKHRAASEPLRRTVTPVYATFGGALVFLIVGNVAEPFTHTGATALGGIAIVFIALVPVAFLVGLLRSRLARGSVVGLLMALDEGKPLREALAQALGDPSLEIAYWLESRSRWVDAHGRSVAEPVSGARRSVSMVERDGRRVAALVHDVSLDEDRELVHGVAAAAALALHSERLQAELRNQYGFLETLVNTAPSLLVTIDLEGRIVNQNLAVLAASGYDDEELIRGRYFWDVFIDPDEREALRERFHAAAPVFAPAQYENSFTNARGELRVIDWRSAPVVDESGTVTGVIAGGIDITERKRQELELRASEERLQAVIESSPVATVELDFDDYVSRWNPAAEQIFGWKAEEVVDRPAPVIPRSRLEESLALNERLRDGQVVPGFETTRLRKDGSEIDVELSAAPVRDAHGNVVGLMGLYMDITSRKQQELERRASEERLRALIHSSPVAIVEVGIDGRPRSWNPAAEEIFGWTAEEVASGPLYLVPEDKAEEYQELLAQVRSGHAYMGVETTRIRKDGSLVDVEISSAPIHDSTGAFVGHMALFVDITERKRRALQLQRERDITQTLMQAIPSLVVVVDAEAIIVDSGVDETRAGVNDAFRRAFGWDDAELVRRSVLELIDEEDGYLARMAIASAANGVAAPERESRWLRADGDRLVIAWTATPVADVTGRRDSLVLLSGIDVTERKRQEEEVRASRARIVQAADDARRKLERNLHDGAQQRLVALSVSLRLAEAKLTGDPAAAASILGAAREELTHALEELRELARGIHPAVLTDRGLSAAVEGLVSRTPLPVDVELPEERLPAAVEAALYYVVSESLANVVKYAGASCAGVRVVVDGDGVVTAEVVDDGAGGADPGRGSGLRGLADRVEALDGTLTVVSPPGEGTRVRVDLPLPGVRPEQAPAGTAR